MGRGGQSEERAQRLQSPFLRLKACALLLALVAGCGDVADDAEVSLRLKWVLDPGFAGEMVAAREGFFGNLTVEIRPGGFEADPIRLVATGADGFGHAGADTFLLARANGVPIVALAAGYIETPVVFYSLTDRDIEEPSDFEGKRVGYQAGQDTATVYSALMSEEGIDRAAITEVPVQYDLTPLVAGQVDVWPGYAATQSYILEQQDISYRVLKPSDFGVSYLGTVYFTSEQMIAEHPAVVEQFVRGIVEGWLWTYNNSEEAIGIVSSYDSEALPPDLVRQNLEVQLPYIRPEGRRFGEYTIEDWRETERILVDQGLLESELDISTFVRFDFLASAYDEASGVP